MTRGRKTTVVVTIIAGTIFIVGAFVWRLWGAPRTEHLSSDFRTRQYMQGTLLVHYEPWTIRQVSPPHELKVTMNDTSQAQPGPNGSVAVLASRQIQAAATLNTVTEQHYILDPRTKKNLRSNQAWAFTPKNVVNRAPAYSIVMPFDTTAELTYELYDNETETKQTLVPADKPERQIRGLDVIRFETNFTAPASDAFIASLDDFNLPDELDAKRFKRVVSDATGIDLESLLNEVLAYLPPTDQELVHEALRASVKLTYVVDSRIVFDVEPRTGIIVNSARTVTSLSAEPQSIELTRVALVLTRYKDVPEIAQALQALTQLADRARARMKFFDLDVAETPASVAATVSDVRTNLNAINRSTRWFPLAAVILGAALIACGIVLAVRQPLARTVTPQASKYEPQPPWPVSEDANTHRAEQHKARSEGHASDSGQG